MKSIFSALVLCLVSGMAYANDGGISAIKVDQIRMRETAIKNGQEVVVRKIAKPSFTIRIEGGEAAKLQQILPPKLSNLTAIQPELAQSYNASFKSLGIYSDKSAQVSSKVISINCNDATLKSNRDGKFRIVKTGKTVCEITITGTEDGMDPVDYFGDAEPFEPMVCR